MVGTRRNLLSDDSSYSNGNGNDFNKYHRIDLESNYGSINPVPARKKFRDAIDQTIQSNRAMQMKKQLIDNVDHEELEMYRKSEESVRAKSVYGFCSNETNFQKAKMHKKQKGTRIL